MKGWKKKRTQIHPHEHDHTHPDKGTFFLRAMFGHTSENKNYFEWVWVWSIMIGGFPFSAITGEKKNYLIPLN
jgi:hypothetical protein